MRKNSLKTWSGPASTIARWALVVLWVAVVASTNAQEDAASGCVDCHESHVESTADGPHGAIDADPSLAALYGTTSSCSGCHGDPSVHLESGDPADIISFGDGATAANRTERCLSCHAKNQPRFHATAHAQVGLDCLSCHAIHDAGPGSKLLDAGSRDASLELDSLVALDVASATCAGCHTATLADFEFNERHRLQEGILGCADCHDPHAPSSRRMLGGFKQQQCAQCHVDKTGPFIFEHGSLKVDGCVSCHEPHAGPNRHQLRFQSVAQLCYSCHIAVPGFHARFTGETVCTNCHSSIHGSNFDPAFLK